MPNMHNPYYGPGAAYPQAGNVTSGSPYSTNQQGAVNGPNSYGTNFTPPGYSAGNQPQSGTSTNANSAPNGKQGGGPGPTVNPPTAGFSNEREIYGNGVTGKEAQQANLSNVSQAKDSTHSSSSAATPPGYYSQGNASLLQGYGIGASQTSAPSNYGQAQNQQQQYAQYMQYSNPNLMPQQMPPPGMGQAANGGSIHHNTNGGYKLGI